MARRNRKELESALTRALKSEAPKFSQRFGEDETVAKLRERVKADGVDAVLPPKPKPRDWPFSYHLARAMVIASAIRARRAKNPPLKMTDAARSALEEKLANRRRVLAQLERERVAIMLGQGRYAYEDVRKRAEAMLSALPMEIAVLEKRLSGA